jgi:hypothetical protein
VTSDVPIFKAFSHIIGGEVKRGKIRSHEKCNARLLIFEPIDTNVRKAIVIPKNPHNHPMALHPKPLYEEKELVADAYKSMGANRVTAKRLRIG